MRTSFEISKKLQEIGFNQTSLFGWFSNKCELVGKFTVPDGIKEGYNFDCYCYDLETIIDNFPITFYKSIYLYLEVFNKRIVGLSDGDKYIYETERHYTDEKENGKWVWEESLADTAARLIILLWDKGLINFSNNK